MKTLGLFVLAATLVAAPPALAQNAGQPIATPPASGGTSPGSPGSPNRSSGGSSTGVNSLTGATTGTGVGVSNNASPRIRTPHPRMQPLNSGASTGRMR